MKIYIEQLKKDDAKDLFTFELTNKSFLKQWYQIVAQNILNLNISKTTRRFINRTGRWEFLFLFNS